VRATIFSFEPAFLVLAAVAAAVYAWAARKNRPPTWRAVVFGVGLFLIAASLNSPLETIAAKRLLLIHLLQNALIADLAPPLILLGLTPAMRGWLDAHGLRRLRARYALPAWSRCGTACTSRASATGRARTGWAATSSTRCSSRSRVLVAARLRVSPAAAAAPARASSARRLGLALIFSSRPFYSFYEHAPRLWGLSPIRDQNLGGIVMNGEQTLVFLLAIGWYVWRLLEDDQLSAADRSPAAS
jgi:cytochrome c oxidase assembly factor CtaG